MDCKGSYKLSRFTVYYCNSLSIKSLIDFNGRRWTSLALVCPFLHQDRTEIEQARAGIGRLHPTADHMRQGCLDHLAGMIGLQVNPVKVCIGL